MNAANPYLIFDGNAHEAFEFYRSVFGGEFAVVIRFSHFTDNAMQVPDDQQDRVAHIALPLSPDHLLMASDRVDPYGDPLAVGNNYYIALDVDSDDEVERIFGALSAGGKVEMPLQTTDWAEKHGMCADRFGVQWMLSYTGNVEMSHGQEGAATATR